MIKKEKRYLYLLFSRSCALSLDEEEKQEKPCVFSSPLWTIAKKILKSFSPSWSSFFSLLSFSFYSTCLTTSIVQHHSSFIDHQHAVFVWEAHTDIVFFLIVYAACLMYLVRDEIGEAQRERDSEREEKRVKYRRWASRHLLIAITNQ